VGFSLLFFGIGPWLFITGKNLFSLRARGGGGGGSRRRHDSLFSSLFLGSEVFSGFLGGDYRRRCPRGARCSGGWVGSDRGDVFYACEVGVPG
jgi:hypothetical protein